MLNTLESLFKLARERKSSPKEGSYTNKLLSDKSLSKEKILEEINELILGSASSKERQIEMIDMGNSFRKIMKDSWELSIPENTSFIYCLTKPQMAPMIVLDL